MWFRSGRLSLHGEVEWVVSECVREGEKTTLASCGEAFSNGPTPSFGHTFKQNIFSQILKKKKIKYGVSMAAVNW